MGIIIDFMMNLIGDEINEDKQTGSQPALTEEQLARLYKRAKQHDLAHLVGDALIKKGLLADPAQSKLKGKFWSPFTGMSIFAMN